MDMSGDQPVDVRRIGEDPDAFEAFYLEHLPVVRRFVARRVADPQLAADLTADGFLASIDCAHGYPPDRGSPAGWLVGIARNVIADEHRRQYRYQRVVQRISGRRLLDPDATDRIAERIDA